MRAFLMENQGRSVFLDRGPGPIKGIVHAIGADTVTLWKDGCTATVPFDTVTGYAADRRGDRFVPDYQAWLAAQP